MFCLYSKVVLVYEKRNSAFKQNERKFVAWQLDTQLVCHASIYITLNLSVWSHPVAVYSNLFPIKEDLLC